MRGSIQQTNKQTELYEEEADVCEKLEGGCAAAAGGGGGGGGGGSGGGEGVTEAAIRYVQDLPPIAPPGHYSVRVVGTTGQSIYDGDALVCVDVEFDMVLPSGSASASSPGVAAAAAGGGAAATVV